MCRQGFSKTSALSCNGRKLNMSKDKQFYFNMYHKVLSNSHCWSIGSFYSCNKNSKELNCEIKKLRPWCIDRNKSGREWRRLIQILKLETINGHIHRLWPAAQTEIFVFLPQQIYQLLFGFFLVLSAIL